MLLVGQQEGHPACKKTEWWGAGMVVCLERGADLHMAQLMPLPLTVSCFTKSQIGFTFLVPAHLGSPGKRAVKRVCVCVCVCVCCITHCRELRKCRFRFPCTCTPRHVNGRQTQRYSEGGSSDAVQVITTVATYY